MLSKRALLTNLYISLPGRRTLSKEINTEIERIHKCNGKAGNYHKILIGDEFYQPVQALASQIRLFHKSITVAWGDRARALPLEKFQEHNEYMGIKIPELQHLYKTNIVDKWEDILSEAANRLQSIYDPKDYPSKEYIETRLRTYVEYRKMEDLRDWRLDVEEEVMDEIVKSAQEGQQREVISAQRELVRRMTSPLRKLAERMNEINAGKSKKFRVNLIETLNTTADEIRNLNIFDDNEINDAASKMENFARSIDVDDLRDNGLSRTAVAANATTMADDIENMLLAVNTMNQREEQTAENDLESWYS